MKKVLVFGVFDGVHEGHRSLFRQAKKLGDYLVVAVAPDEVIRELKGRIPKHEIGQRLTALGDEDLVDQVVAGDAELGSYGVLKTQRPDVVALGYDQLALKIDLESRMRQFDWVFDIIVLEPFHPEKYKSSMLNGKKSSN